MNGCYGRGDLTGMYLYQGNLLKLITEAVKMRCDLCLEHKVDDISDKFRKSVKLGRMYAVHGKVVYSGLTLS